MSNIKDLESMEKIKIVISIKGGVLDSVFASLPGDRFSVALVDFDDMEAEGIPGKEQDQVWFNTISNAPHNVY